MSARLLCWNVAGRVQRLQEQLESIRTEAPDLICLQEVRTARNPGGSSCWGRPADRHPDGRVWTFARTRTGKLRPDRGERWDVAELSLIKGLEAHGFRDAFRELYGPQVRELSWEWQQWGGGYRLDHLIVSREVAVREVTYVHDWRRAGLSDHSPLAATLTWSGVRVV
ncbi:MAG TPA: hypothetical protein VIM18_04650 [Solirubrobacteraceae bacterium]